MELSNKLFHYTGAGALLSIVTKRQLWATVAEFMNDKHEGTLASRALSNICDDVKTFAPELVRYDPSLVEALRWSLSNGRVVAVLSFSRHWRSLPMYRMYAPSAGGFMIGFPRSFLQNLGTLIDVDYSNKALVQWARSYAAEYLNAASEIVQPGMTAQEINNHLVRSTDLIHRRVLAGFKFKGEEFSNEAESRLVILGQATHFRESRDGNYIIPFLKLDVPNDKIEVPISYGPNRDPRLAHDSVTQAIRAAHLAGTEWNLGHLSSGEYGFRI